MHNFVDDLSWTKGKHSIQFGVNYRLIHDQVGTDAYSYNTAESYIGESHDDIANTGESLDPGAFGFPAVATTFNTSYSYAAMNLAGIVAWGADNYSYLAGNGMGTLQPQGAMVSRDFKTNQLDYYIEDTWHALPRLSVTFGVRQMFIQTPYEVNGQQVSPTFSLNDWLQTRAQQAALGNSVQPEISFAPSGQGERGQTLLANGEDEHRTTPWPGLFFELEHGHQHRLRHRVRQLWLGHCQHPGDGRVRGTAGTKRNRWGVDNGGRGSPLYQPAIPSDVSDCAAAQRHDQVPVYAAAGRRWRGLDRGR